MRGMFSLMAVVMCLFLAMVTGCAVNTVREVVAKGSVEGARPWGRTVLLFQVAPHASRDESRKRIDEIAGLAGQALEAVPGVEQRAPDTLLARIANRNPAGVSDGELAAAALDAGVDTVVLVQVLAYGGELTISLLPPYWATGTDFAFHARVIDARTGALYLDAHRGRKKGGAFTAHGSRELGEDFKANLESVFTEAAKAKPVNTGSAS